MGCLKFKFGEGLKMLSKYCCILKENYGEIGSGVLGSVPTALTRWTEESRVLDGDSLHDCVTGMVLEMQFTESKTLKIKYSTTQNLNN